MALSCGSRRMKSGLWRVETRTPPDSIEVHTLDRSKELNGSTTVFHCIFDLISHGEKTKNAEDCRWKGSKNQSNNSTDMFSTNNFIVQCPSQNRQGANNGLAWPMVCCGLKRPLSITSMWMVLSAAWEIAPLKEAQQCSGWSKSLPDVVVPKAVMIRCGPSRGTSLRYGRMPFIICHSDLSIETTKTKKRPNKTWKMKQTRFHYELWTIS